MPLKPEIYFHNNNREIANLQNFQFSSASTSQWLRRYKPLPSNSQPKTTFPQQSELCHHPLDDQRTPTLPGDFISFRGCESGEL